MNVNDTKPGAIVH